MKIFDCFMYFDEDIVLDVRLNYLDKYVDQFIIIESEYNHKGEKRTPLFDINKFKKFEKCQPPSLIIFILVNLVFEKKVSTLKKEYFLSFIFLNH